MDQAKAIRTYRRTASTKAELREALAFALGIPHTVQTKPQNLRDQMRDIFNQVYFQQTGLEYCWVAKDYTALKQLETKLPVVMVVEATPTNLLKAWRYTLEHLPKWYAQNGFSPPIINSKLNEIIQQIQNERSNNSSTKERQNPDYQKGLLHRLRS